MRAKLSPIDRLRDVFGNLRHRRTARIRRRDHHFEHAIVAVTHLEIGKVSEPILTSSGYHLVRVERMDPPKPLEQVEAEIRQRLATQYFYDALNKAPKGWDIKLD